MLIITLIIFAVYTFFIIIYSISWFKLKTFIPSKSKSLARLSILIPMRNEEDKIILLLKDIYKQEYSKELFEVIVIDDNSTDNSIEVVKSFITSHPEMSLKILRIENTDHFRAYKKYAITMAVDEAIGDLIITTDADCRVENKWLNLMASYYQENKFRMIVGPVKYEKEKNIFEKAQSLEFISLIGITAGAVKIGWPLMCNGANLAYDKNTFYEVNGYDKDTFSSGDDIFLLMKIRRRFGAGSIGFLKNKSAFVQTRPQKDIKSFFNQRKRWASKNKAFQLEIVAVALIVFLTNFLIILNLVCGICDGTHIEYFLIFWGAKFVVDIPIVIGIASYIKRTSLLKTLIPLGLLYPFYIVFTGIIGVLGNYEWKGRKIKK